MSQEDFNIAVDYFNTTKVTLSASTDQTRLLRAIKLYSLYKQATIGDCNIPKPSILNRIANYKWYAWNNLKGMTKETAQQQYIDIYININLINK